MQSFWQVTKIYFSVKYSSIGLGKYAYMLKYMYMQEQSVANVDYVVLSYIFITWT